MRRVQTGFVMNYALGMLLGAVAVVGVPPDAALTGMTLTLVTFIPAVGAVLVALLPRAPGGGG